MDTVTIQNLLVHKNAKLTKGEFLERIKNVRQIRHANSEVMPYLPEEKSQWEYFKLIHGLVRGNQADRLDTGRVIFQITLQKGIYDWLRSLSWTELEDAILVWAAAEYRWDTRARGILGSSVWRPFWTKVKNMAKTRFGGHPSYHKKEIEQLLFAGFPPFDKYNYKRIKTQIGIAPTISVDGFEILNTCYFSQHHWDAIVLRDSEKLMAAGGYKSKSDVLRDLKLAETDDLERGEGSAELWEEWKHNFTTN